MKKFIFCLAFGWLWAICLIMSLVFALCTAIIAVPGIFCDTIAEEIEKKYYNDIA